MEEKKTSGPSASGPHAESEDETSYRHRRSFEEKLDDFAERFSRATGDAVHRLEDAFDRQMKKGREGGVRNFFRSSTGGAVLIVVGTVWFFYAVGLFDFWLIPLLIVLLGVYLMNKYKDEGDA